MTLKTTVCQENLLGARRKVPRLRQNRSAHKDKTPCPAREALCAFGRGLVDDAESAAAGVT